MIVWPGLRRSVSAIQRLFNSASVSLPLTHTAIPTRGDITPTFTRATTATGQKWDETGYLDFTALAGEMVFKGARREYNQWTTSSVSLASGANKSLTLAAGTYQFSMGAGTGTATFSGTGGATGTLAASTGRVSVAKTISAGTFVVTASVADLADLQVCNITGETDQTTIRPYVSVGVESAPAYHGSMVDGVKCYNTDRSGNPISTSGSYPLVGYVPWEARTNLCLQSQTFDNASWLFGASGTTNPVVTANQAVAPDGTITADKINFPAVPSGAGNRSVVYQGITQTAVAYNDSVYLKGAVGGEVVRVASSDGITWQSSSTLTLTTDWVRYSVTGTRTAAVWYLHIGVDQRAGQTLPTSAQTIYAWGAQVEPGSFATPYIPTTTVAVARNADLLTYTGADVANIKTLAATFSRGVGINNVGVHACLYSDSTHYITSFLNSATDARFIGSDATVQWNTSASNAYAAGAISKMSQTWTTNNVLMDKDGTAQIADVSASVPAYTSIGVGHLNGTLIHNGPVNHIYGWTRNLSQSELGAIDA